MIIPACFKFLSSNAIGQWHETYTMKLKGTDKYVHKIQRDMMLLRVETGTIRAFYWIYSLEDAIRFNEHASLKLKMEVHEIILTPRVKLFFDIDLKLDVFQKEELANYYQYDLTDENETKVMEAVAKKVGVVIKDSILISLEEHGVDDSDLMGFDWMATMRNRPLKDEGFKVSVHLITNLMLPTQACRAIATHVRHEVIENNMDILEIDESIASLLISSIDVEQLRKHGSLSLPFGTKKTEFGEYTNWIYKNYDRAGQRYFLTVGDQHVVHDIDLSGYNIVEKSNFTNEASPEFVKEALAHAGNIPDYNARVWDLNSSILKKSTMYVKRYASSYCSICKRTHDNDNTLFLIFNSDMGIASWKCARDYDMKPIIFYRKEFMVEEESMDDIEQFAANYSKPPQVKRPVQVQHEQFDHEEETDFDDLEAFASMHVGLKATVDTECDDVEDPNDSNDPIVSPNTVFDEQTLIEVEAFAMKHKGIKYDTSEDLVTDPEDYARTKKRTFINSSPVARKLPACEQLCTPGSETDSDEDEVKAPVKQKLTRKCARK